jgi:S1-C subfamily serine protease
MPATLPSLAAAARPSIVRVIVHPRRGKIDAGTGFLYMSQNRVVTCAHLLFRTGQIGDVVQKNGIQEENELYLRALFRRTVDMVEIERADGNRIRVTDVQFDGATDIAFLRIEEKAGPALKISDRKPNIGEDVFLCGFPHAVDTKIDAFPFAAWKGSVMGYGQFRVGGYKKRELAFMSGWALWGASGSPVFATNGSVIGMLTGQMAWGADSLAFIERKKGKNVLKKDKFYIPLPYGYVTLMETITRVYNSRPNSAPR